VLQNTDQLKKLGGDLGIQGGDQGGEAAKEGGKS
jgi:hypothetical protein